MAKRLKAGDSVPITLDVVDVTLRGVTMTKQKEFGQDKVTFIYQDNGWNYRMTFREDLPCMEITKVGEIKAQGQVVLP